MLRPTFLLVACLGSLGCERFSSTAPGGDARLNAPADADAEYPPTCSELGPATCTGPCSRGEDPAACLHLAEGYLEGVGVSRDPERAMELMRDACNAGFGRACGYLAAAIGQQKPQESRALGQRGCELGYGGACVWFVGEHIAATDPPDWAAAAPWLRRGCEAQHGVACLLWADLQRTGIGATKDLPAAKASYRSACELGLSQACPFVEGTPEGAVVHPVATPDPSVAHASGLRGMKGRYQPKVSICVQHDGTVQIRSLQGAPGALGDLVRATLERWRFAPSEAAAEQACTTLQFNYLLQ